MFNHSCISSYSQSIIQAILVVIVRLYYHSCISIYSQTVKSQLYQYLQSDSIITALIVVIVRLYNQSCISSYSQTVYNHSCISSQKLCLFWFMLKPYCELVCIGSRTWKSIGGSMSPRNEHGSVCHAWQREDAFSCSYFEMRKVQSSVLLEMPSHSAN